MKTLPEFLVERNVVSPDTLVVALVEQLRSVPTVIEIVHRLKLIPASGIVQAVSRQSEHGTDFRTACRDLGLWSAEVESRVSSEVAATRLPILESLLSAGAITTDQLNKELDAYLAETVPKRPAAPVAAPVSAPVEKAPASPASTAEPVAAAAPPAASVQPAVLLFCEQFNAPVKDFLERRLGSSQDASGIKETKEILHRLGGAARLARLSRCEAELNRLKDSLQESLPSSSGLAEAWRLRERVAASGTDIE